MVLSRKQPEFGPTELPNVQRMYRTKIMHATIFYTFIYVTTTFHKGNRNRDITLDICFTPTNLAFYSFNSLRSIFIFSESRFLTINFQVLYLNVTFLNSAFEFRTI